jgi:hypothetical protein
LELMQIKFPSMCWPEWGETGWRSRARNRQYSFAGFVIFRFQWKHVVIN